MKVARVSKRFLRELENFATNFILSKPVNFSGKKQKGASSRAGFTLAQCQGPRAWIKIANHLTFLGRIDTVRKLFLRFFKAT